MTQIVGIAVRVPIEIWADDVLREETEQEMQELVIREADAKGIELYSVVPNHREYSFERFGRDEGQPAFIPCVFAEAELATIYLRWSARGENV